MEITTKSAEETQRLGKKLANRIAESLRHKDESRIIALVGGLGAGKTTFVQGMASGLGIETRIISPTFIIMRTYKIGEKIAHLNNLYHLDFYREGSDDIQNLGLKDVLEAPDNIVVIEWAEKVKELLPKNTIWIYFETDEDNRKITFESMPAGLSI